MPGNVLWRWALAPLTDVTQGVLSVGGQLWGQYLGLRKQPGAIADYARVAAAIAEEIGRLALLPGDSQTRFKGQPGTVKRVAWSEPASLAEIKACGKLLGCSVNDTLLSCVAGALRGYLVAKGERVENTEIRVMVPVNLRAPDDAETLGNRFGLVALELPIGIANPLARLYAIRARMAALKGSYQALLTFALLGATGMAPSFVEEQVLKVLASKTTAVMTNVPGAQQARYLAGARDRPADGLGPAGRRHRHGRQHPLLQRPGAIWPDHRQGHGRRSAEHRRSLCRRVRKAALAGPVATRRPARRPERRCRRSGPQRARPAARRRALSRPVRRAQLRRRDAPSRPSATKSAAS
jgi:hypothetical protein